MCQGEGRKRPVRWGAVRAGGGRTRAECSGSAVARTAGARLADPGPLPAPELPLLHHVQYFPGGEQQSPWGLPVPSAARSMSSPHPCQSPWLPPRRFASHLHAPYVRQDLMGGVSARTHTCIHTASLRSRSWEDAGTFYPGTRSTRRRTQNGRRERRPCWTGIRLPCTRLAAAPPARAPVRPSVRPSALPPCAHGAMGSPRPRRSGGAGPPAPLTRPPAPGLRPGAAEIPRPCFSAAGRERPGEGAERSHSPSKRCCAPPAFVSSSVDTLEPGLLIPALASSEMSLTRFELEGQYKRFNRNKQLRSILSALQSTVCLCRPPRPQQ